MPETNVSETAKEEFFEAVMCLLFFSAFEPVVTSSAQLFKKVSENLKIAGSAENIEVWRCLTPQQLPILKGRVQKVMFFNAPSTGKTTLMTSEACYLAREKGEDVVFFIPGTFGNNQKTLMAISMEHQFQTIERMEVCTIRKRTKGIDYPALLDLVRSERYRNCHMFFDEIHIDTDDDVNILKEVTLVCQDRTLWMAVTSMNNSMAAKVASEFEEFYKPDDLVNPLRNTSSIVKFAYDLQGTSIVYICFHYFDLIS